MGFAKFRSALFVIHMWIGLVLGLLLALLGLSGSVLVYDDVIGDFLAPPPQVTSQGAPLPLDAIVDAARGVAGRGVITVSPATPGEAATVRVMPAGRGGDGAQDGARRRRGNGQAAGPSPQGNRGLQVFVDPVSGKVLGTRSAALPPLLQFAHQLHGNFMLPRQTGRAFVGWLGVAMLILGVTGLVLWWPKRGQWNYAFLVRRTAKGLRFHRELHAMVGIWAFVIFMIVSFSGVAIAFPDTVRALVGGHAVARPAFSLRDGPAVAPQDGKRIGADDAAAAAQKALPGATLRSVTLPARRDQAISVSMASHGANANVWLDPWSGAVLAMNDPMAGGGDIMAWQRPLHQGNGLGAVYRALVFAVGFVPLLFVVTGIVMWWKKRKAHIAMNRPLLEEGAP